MNNGREIELYELFYYILKKWRIILVAAVPVAFIAGACTLVAGKGSAIFSAIIGAMVAVVACAVCVMIYGALTRTMWSNSGWRCCEIPVLGRIPAPKEEIEGEKVDRWLDKLMGFASSANDMEQASALAAANVAAAMSEKNKAVAVISASDSGLYNEIVSYFNKHESCEFKLLGNVLTDASAVSAISNYSEIVLLAESDVVTVDEVNEIVSRLSIWGKKLLGVILVK